MTNSRATKLISIASSDQTVFFFSAPRFEFLCRWDPFLLLINLVFAGLYLLGGRSIAELPTGSFSDAFSFCTFL